MNPTAYQTAVERTMKGTPIVAGDRGCNGQGWISFRTDHGIPVAVKCHGCDDCLPAPSRD